jgi:hypothetical protein
MYKLTALILLAMAVYVTKVNSCGASIKIGGHKGKGHAYGLYKCKTKPSSVFGDYVTVEGYDDEDTTEEEKRRKRQAEETTVAATTAAVETTTGEGSSSSSSSSGSSEGSGNGKYKDGDIATVDIAGILESLGLTEGTIVCTITTTDGDEIEFDFDVASPPEVELECTDGTWDGVIDGVDVVDMAEISCEVGEASTDATTVAA